MKKLMLAGLLGLSFLAVGSEARAGVLCLGGEICIGGRAWARKCDCAPSCNQGCGGGGCGLGGGGYGAGYGAPWYMYYPYGAYFTDPAPTGYPYWPPAMVPYGGQATFSADGYAAPGYPPSGYSSQIPSYWYGH